MIALEGVEFRYRADKEELFGGLDHTFPQGEVTVVTGASGRGKSTLLYLAGLILTPVCGSVSIGSAVASRLSDAERSRLRARHIGFVFQDAGLDPSRTVLDNVVEGAIYDGWLREQAEARARELLERFGVTVRDNHRPGEISGGQAQRVGLCRALIKQPDIVLGDEPTGNLDHDSASVVMDALAEAAVAGATIVVATHDPRVIERADNVLAL